MFVNHHQKKKKTHTHTHTNNNNNKNNNNNQLFSLELFTFLDADTRDPVVSVRGAAQFNRAHEAPARLRTVNPYWALRREAKGDLVQLNLFTWAQTKKSLAESGRFGIETKDPFMMANETFSEQK